MHRRQFLKTTGGLLVTTGSLGRLAIAGDQAKRAMPSPDCRPTIRLTRGPYLVPNSPLRSDIREDRAGVPLKLKFSIVDHYFCQPLAGARIDVWHSDASGLYSGVENIQFDFESMRLTDRSIDMRGKSFLRGHQVSDGDGRVEFQTIFPGWYLGRLPHLHVMATVGDIDWLTFDTQLFFAQEIERTVYQSPAYATRGQNPVGLDRDLVLRGDDAALRALTVPLAQIGDGFEGEVVLAMTA